LNKRSKSKKNWTSNNKIFIIYYYTLHINIWNLE
jgi:hypothetical protein